MTPEQKIRRKEIARIYGKTVKGRAIFLRKAYQRVDECDLTVDEMIGFISQPCVHCGTIEEPRGLDRIDNALPHIAGNVASSCAPCNFARGDRFSFDEMKRIGAVIKEIFQDRKTKATGNEAHLGTVCEASKPLMDP